jgi:hypothetical protein
VEQANKLDRLVRDNYTELLFSYVYTFEHIEKKKYPEIIKEPSGKTGIATKTKLEIPLDTKEFFDALHARAAAVKQDLSVDFYIPEIETETYSLSKTAYLIAIKLFIWEVHGQQIPEDWKDIIRETAELFKMAERIESHDIYTQFMAQEAQGA